MMPRNASFVLCLLATLAGASQARPGIRQPILAGTWYPGDPKLLRQAVASYIPDSLAGCYAGGPAPLALIVPHAGYRFSGATAGRAYAAVRGRDYDRVILLGPSHHVAFEGAALPVEDSWATPLGEVPLDIAAIASLAGSEGFARLPAAHDPEHSLEIQLPFLQVALATGIRLVPIVIGRLDAAGCRDVAKGLAPLLGPTTLLVASSDFTHYGPDYDFVPFRDNIATRLRTLDLDAAAAIQTRSADSFEQFCSRTHDTICGREPIRVLLSLLQGEHARVDRLGYARSGDLMGDFTNSVSYFAFAFLPEPGGGAGGSIPPRDGPRKLDDREGAFLLDLARGTIAARLRGVKPPPSEAPAWVPMDSPLREVRGVFVTLTENGDLRGCIGSISGEEPLVQGVAHQALNSAFRDPRFAGLRADELDSIDIEISVLTPPAAVPGYESIVVGRHGVFLEKNGRRAVFLPQVAAEQGWDRDTMLRHLSLKAGLGPEDWKTGASFEVFEAQILEEAPAR